MTIRDLFYCVNTDSRRILIYDKNDNVIYQKHSNKPIGKLDYWDCKVAWIYKIDSEEIAVRIE